MAEVRRKTAGPVRRSKAPNNAVSVLAPPDEPATSGLSKEDEHSIMLPILREHRKIVLNSEITFVKLLDFHMRKWRPFLMPREQFQATMQALAATVASTQLEALVRHLTGLKEWDKCGPKGEIPRILKLIDYRTPRDKTAEMIGQALLLNLHEKLNAPLSTSKEGELERLLRQSDHEVLADHCAEESIRAVLASKYKKGFDEHITKDEIDYWRKQLEQAVMIHQLTADFGFGQCCRSRQTTRTS